MNAKRNYKVTRGSTLRCKGWRQESILRMLENNLENAEDAENLVIYASLAKAARDWDCYDRIEKCLMEMEESQTLVVQSGKPIGVFETYSTAPLVVIANGNISTSERLPAREYTYEMLDKNKLMLPGMTAGAWQYIGSQGIIQGTYETFMAAARTSFDGDLRGRTILTAGCGGMGGAQPLAGVMAGASILVADVRAEPMQVRIDQKYLEYMTDDIDEAIDMWVAAAAEKRPASIGVVANIVEVNAKIAERNIVPDIVTDQTTTELKLGYYPEGLSPEEADAMRKSDPDRLVELNRMTMAKHMRAILEFKRRGSVTFEYGNGLQKIAKYQAGVEDAYDMGLYMTKYIRPLFCEGIGPFRWLAISGNPDDITKVDDMLMEMFAEEPRVTNWLQNARRIEFSGLPARICWLAHGERHRVSLKVNEMVRNGELSGPIAFSRDHHDCGGASVPERETYDMKDGSDAVTDWAILNCLLNTSSGADLVAIHSHFAAAVSSGLTVVADGSDAADERISRAHVNDTGLGVLRYEDAGYEVAAETCRTFGLGFHD